MQKQQKPDCQFPPIPNSLHAEIADVSYLRQESAVGGWVESAHVDVSRGVRYALPMHALSISLFHLHRPRGSFQEETLRFQQRHLSLLHQNFHVRENAGVVIETEMCINDDPPNAINIPYLIPLSILTGFRKLELTKIRLIVARRISTSICKSIKSIRCKRDVTRVCSPSSPPR